MESYIPHIFIINIVLALCDVSLGYFLAPVLGRMGQDGDEDAVRTIRIMRRLLSFVVALYMFLNCLAYSGKSPGFLLAVTAVILLDMTGQLLLSRKLRNRASGS